MAGKNEDLEKRIKKILILDHYYRTRKAFSPKEKRLLSDIVFLIDELKRNLGLIITERVKVNMLEEKLKGEQNHAG